VIMIVIFFVIIFVILGQANLARIASFCG
jgi:hypothetical protein